MLKVIQIFKNSLHFTKVCNLTLLTPSHYNSQRYILTLSSHQWLNLPSGFLTENAYVFLFSPLQVTCSMHFILLHVITLIIFGEE
jgi:hypothetical protein